MSILNLLYYPDKRLRNVALPVKINDNITNIKKIIHDMFDTMYAMEGIGLAATQVNIHQRIIVIDLLKQNNSKHVLINPQILEKSGKNTTEEGCLSIPTQRAFIERKKLIKIRAINYHMKVFELTTDGLLSICIQHEIDHLNGKLFIDYLSILKRQRIKKKFEKLARNSLFS
ncbi:peptide deformylase [Candidatus Tachikawaea gelatinosa]|uniref:Peptide deformylase n=1 Tax=Candidatus Tachikawaea gelatinosa TaxID=1410383 RepID=A0A090BWF8_9ENTR|nr:peptide deformylase [Candidatus Tachikawaea gelatinosa]BAP58531.1 peptide deformylase [Candidatus Tachikawaea gelatinosa]